MRICINRTAAGKNLVELEQFTGQFQANREVGVSLYAHL